MGASTLWINPPIWIWYFRIDFSLSCYQLFFEYNFHSINKLIEITDLENGEG